MNKEYEITLQEMKALKKKIAIRFSLIPLFLVLIILLPAGTLMFWQVYTYFAVLPVSLILRILNEEKVLSNNLQGYHEYCHKTRFRLIPFIW